MEKPHRLVDPGGAAPRGRLDKRHAIMLAARAVFLRDGYAGATVEAVALEAGVSKQTIYNHLQDKSSLFVTVVEEVLDRAVGDILSAVEDFPDHPAELEVELLTIAWRLINSFVDRDALAIRRLIFSEISRHPILIEVWRKRGLIRVVSALAARFTRLTQNGYLEMEDPDGAARQFVALTVYDPLLQSVMGTRDVPGEALERTANSAVLMFLRLYAPH